MSHIRFAGIIAVVLAGFALSACSVSTSSDEKEEAKGPEKVSMEDLQKAMKEAAKEAPVVITSKKPEPKAAPAAASGDDEYARAKELKKYNGEQTMSMRFPEKTFAKEVAFHEKNIGKGVEVSKKEVIWPAMSAGNKCMAFYVKDDGSGYVNGIYKYSMGQPGFDQCKEKADK